MTGSIAGIVRAIEALNDAVGRTVASLGLGRRGVVDTRVPLPAPATIYAKWGNMMKHWRV